MSKTFKSVLGKSDSRRVRIESRPEGPNLWISDNSWGSDYGITLAPSDAPALCLAILEAAGYVDLAAGGKFSRISNAIYLLREHIELEARDAAAEADRVALEQEALALVNAKRAFYKLPTVASWDGFQDGAQDEWLAVARAARELNKEANNA